MSIILKTFGGIAIFESVEEFVKYQREMSTQPVATAFASERSRIGTRTYYTPEEEALLADINFNSADEVADLATKLGRTTEAVRLKARRVQGAEPIGRTRKRSRTNRERAQRESYKTADNGGSAWTAEEENMLIEEHQTGFPAEEIAELHGRTYESVTTRIRDLRRKGRVK